MAIKPGANIAGSIMRLIFHSAAMGALRHSGPAMEAISEDEINGAIMD